MSAGSRTVFFADIRDPSTLLGGLAVTPGITTATFHRILEIALTIPGPYTLHHVHSSNSSQTAELPRDSSPLLPGTYLISADSPVTLSQEELLVRTYSRDSSAPRVREFRDAVRDRDGRCVATKQPNRRARLGIWAGFRAAHIFPLAHQAYWDRCGLGACVSLPSETGGAINSVQNGVLLRADVQQLFDGYDFAIDPDVSASFCFPPSLRNSCC